MEKTVTIGGKDYTMKSTAANLLKYKAQFGRDLMSDVMKLQKAQRDDGSWDFEKIDLGMLYDMVWLLIKAANPDLPPPMQWLDTLDTFPLKEAASEAMLMYVQSMEGTIKNG